MGEAGSRGCWNPSWPRPGVLVGLGGWACCLTSLEDEGLLRERMGSADTQKSLTPSGHNFKTPKKASNSTNEPSIPPLCPTAPPPFLVCL